MTRGAVALLAAALVTLAACGGEAATPTTGQSTTVPITVAPSTTASTPSPAELGDQIGDLYLAAYEDVVALLADRPAPADVAEELAALKERYVQDMVALGYQREALDDAGRAVVDGRITAALGRVPAATYEAYQQAFSDYASDLEVANLIAAFNTIGQYANFDLLRQQAPEEAARLGIG